MERHAFKVDEVWLTAKEYYQFVTFLLPFVAFSWKLRHIPGTSFLADTIVFEVFINFFNLILSFKENIRILLASQIKIVFTIGLYYPIITKLQFLFNLLQKFLSLLVHF